MLLGGGEAAGALLAGKSVDVGAVTEVGGCGEDGMGSSENRGGAEEAGVEGEGNKEDDEAVGAGVGSSAVDNDGSGVG